MKIGGGKSGNTFKIHFQIVNECSAKTCDFCCFVAGDSVINLHSDWFRDQVKQLQGMKLRQVMITIQVQRKYTYMYMYAGNTL